jgi:hypothetical protein
MQALGISRRDSGQDQHLGCERTPATTRHCDIAPTEARPRVVSQFEFSGPSRIAPDGTRMASWPSPAPSLAPPRKAPSSNAYEEYAVATKRAADALRAISVPKEERHD